MGETSKKPSKASAKKQAAQRAKIEAKEREVKRIKDRVRGKKYFELSPIEKGVLLYEEGVSTKLIEGALGLTRRQILSGAKAKKAGKSPGVKGRPPTLNAQQEIELKEAIKKGFDSQDSWTIQRINQEVSWRAPFFPFLPPSLSSDLSLSHLQATKISGKQVSQSWGVDFLKRHEDIKLSPSREVDKTASREEIDKYFATLKKLRDEHKYPEKSIYNFDETMLDFSAKKSKVVVPSSARYGVINVKEIGFHITLGLCIAADGGWVSPLLILPLKNFPSELSEHAGKYCWSGQESGWITKEIFELYIDKVFIPHVDTKRSGDERVLLILDGHSSRANDKLLQRMRDKRIDVLVLPAHASHLLQPLDLTVNGVLKSNLSKFRHDMRFETRPQLRQDLISATNYALHIAMYPGTIKNGFARAGIEPFLPSRVDNSPCTPAALLATSLTEINTEAKETSVKRFTISNNLITEAGAISELKKQRLIAEEKKNKEKGKGKNAQTDQFSSRSNEVDADDTWDGENEEQEHPRASRRAKRKSKTSAALSQTPVTQTDAPRVEPEAQRPKRVRRGRFQSVFRELDFPSSSTITGDDFVDASDEEYLASLCAGTPAGAQDTTTSAPETDRPQLQSEPPKSPQMTPSISTTTSGAVSDSSSTICFPSIAIDDLTVGSTPAAPSSRPASATRLSRRSRRSTPTPSQNHHTPLPATFSTPAPTAGHFLPGGAVDLAVPAAVTA